ncbi:unnamed protein product [Urochloa decumbens]|uniref:No apical meristem-associated C-terminal domain-containing protein n=1 Tax=Urochloa decumbens TaxID=240449 RepID=A0ABC8YK17_9POAL
MSRQSRRTLAPPPPEIPSPATRLTMPLPPPPLLPQSTPPPFPSIYGGPGTWFPPGTQQSMAPSSVPCWFPAVQQPGMAGGPRCLATSLGASTGRTPTPDQEEPDLQAWGSDSHPPGGFVNLLKKSTSNPTQVMGNGSSSQPINVGDDTNNGDCARTEKRLLWTKEEDLRLVSAWLNNSNDPIQANYKKNDQYWKGVAAVFNSTTPKNRARQAKQVKDHFGRIKKRVAWFCGSWKEANAMWASGESDVDLMERALASYEEDHKKDGPFMFKHCWDVLRKEPKWDAYLERLDEEIEPENRKFNVQEDVTQHFSLDDVRDERPIGGKKAKEQQKRKRKDEACIIDLEDELHKFVDAQNTANEGRKEMLETQRRVSNMCW